MMSVFNVDWGTGSKLLKLFMLKPALFNCCCCCCPWLPLLQPAIDGPAVTVLMVVSGYRLFLTALTDTPPWGPPPADVVKGCIWF